jgi:hypothetical protein
MLRRFRNFFWCPILRYFLMFFFSSETGGVICWFHFWFYQFHLKCEYHRGYSLKQASVEPSSTYPADGIMLGPILPYQPHHVSWEDGPYHKEPVRYLFEKKASQSLCRRRVGFQTPPEFSVFGGTFHPAL